MEYDQRTSLLLNKEKLLKRLLKYGLFSERLPKCFSSEKFGKYIYDAIENNKFNSNEKYKYKHTTFPLTQETQTRLMAVPNCIGYANLCYILFKSWDNICKYLLKNWKKGNPNFIRMCSGNKRLYRINDYDGSTEIIYTNKSDRLIKLNNVVYNKYSILMNMHIFKRYKLHLDISKFYHTIYSHSLSWALIGKDKEKELYRDRAKRKQFIKENYDYESIEKQVMKMQDDESFGLPIGPDTSFILADILLSKIDAEMQNNFSYYRYIDDFNYYAETDEDAAYFEGCLRKNLYTYKLQINDTKKEIEKLPTNIENSWVCDLNNYDLPICKGRKDIGKLIYFFDKCTNEARTNGARVIKYGLTKLSNFYSSKESINEEGRCILFDFVFFSISLYPYLISILENFMAFMDDISKVTLFLNSLLKRALKNTMYDIIVWILYLSIKYNIKLDTKCLIYKRNILCQDCLSVTLLYYYMKTTKKKKYVNNIFKNFFDEKIKNKFEKEYWLLEYELYFNDVITIDDDNNDYYKSEIKKMKTKGISFIKF